MEQKLFSITYKSHGFYGDFDGTESVNSLICFEENLDEALTFIWDEKYSYMKDISDFHNDQYRNDLFNLLKDKEYFGNPIYGAETLWITVDEVTLFKSQK